MLHLPRAVIVLGLVSFLNDAASEMITPLLPVFLTVTLGTGPAVVGLVEGVAEATSSLLKLVSGRLADRGWRRKPLVLGGYSLSIIARPLVGLALNWSWVLLVRFLDRIGKGVRTSPRDALIAASTERHWRGRSFGFHRAMDNAGGMLGPLLAFLLLGAGLSLQQVFLWSAVPGGLVILLLVVGVQEAQVQQVRQSAPTAFRWRDLDRRLQGLILTAGGLSLAAVPEVFLVLWATDRGLQIAWVALIWAAASAVKALIAGPAGLLSDRYGRLPVLVTGWSLRMGVLVVLPLLHSSVMAVWSGFLAYSASLAVTEAAERALIGDSAAREHRATAYGLYHMVVGVAALPGAVLFGALWQWAGEMAAFFTAAALTLLSLILLWWFVPPRRGA
jgi:MFS family permease